MYSYEVRIRAVELVPQARSHALVQHGRVQQATVLTKNSKSVPEKELDGFVVQGYGIFAGNKVQWAKLRFSAERARWVSRELWHPQQKMTEAADGSLMLEVPFTDIESPRF